MAETINLRRLISDRFVEACNITALLVGDEVLQQNLLSAAELCARALRNGNKIMLCGNGGSAGDAQHIAAELVGRFSALRRPGLAALALTTDTSVLTAIANDFGYSHIFATQVEALGRPGDVLIGISTSGKSDNVNLALQEAIGKRIEVIALTGGDGGRMIELRLDACIRVPSRVTPRIQEAHILIGHTLCELIETIMFKGEK